MRKKICFGSFDELDKGEFGSKYFEGGKIFTDIDLWAKKIEEHDPDGKKADALAEKY